MPILIKNQTPAKGQEAEFEIDKDALAALTSVAADAYFSDTDNWRQVFIKYKSSVGNQTETIEFDATQTNPSGIFLVSAKARDLFEVQNIIIKDYDDGLFVVRRSELTTSEFDIDMSVAPPASISWTRSNAVVAYGSNGGLINTGTQGWNQGAYSTAITGDFVLEYDVTILTAGSFIGDIMFGYSTSLPSLNGSYPNRGIYIDAGFAATPYGGGFESGWTTTMLSSVNVQNTLIITRVGGLITYSYTNGTNTNTGTIQSSYSGPIYPHVLVYNTGARLDAATIIF
jgi:hypothetical protein